MSVDEALLLHSRDAPCLRLYRFATPSVTVGLRERELPWLARARSLGIEVVRRASGGGAVLHAGDLTYAVVVPRGCADVPERVHESYAWVRTALVAGLRSAGVDATASAGSAHAARDALCFRASTGSEIDVGPAKLVGSAQRRMRSGFLQHGSIRLSDDSALYRALFGVALPAPALPAGVTFEAVECAVIDAFAAACGRPLEPATLDADERRTAQGRDTRRRASPCGAPTLSLRTAALSADTHP